MSIAVSQTMLEINQIKWKLSSPNFTLEHEYVFVILSPMCTYRSGCISGKQYADKY